MTILNIIDEKTTREELAEEYRQYPSTVTDENESFYENRFGPIFYEVPLNSKVLDVGANDGTFMKLLKEKRKCEVFGIDISEVAIEEAKKKDLDVQYADAHKIPFPDKTFDVVILMEVLSHVHNPLEVLREIKRVLKKNGVLLGSVPHKNIQRLAWEDKRKIREYYEVADLSRLLTGVFDHNFIKVMNGAQFAMSLANSILGDLPAEMLFKSGNKKTEGWDAGLQDKSILRCWFGMTQTPGTAYYRMSGFADKMQKTGAQTFYNPYNEHDFNSPAEWINKIHYVPCECKGQLDCRLCHGNGRRLTNPHIVGQLESLLKAADMSVWQITSSRSFLLVLTTAKLGVVQKPMWVEMDDWIFDIVSYNNASGPYHPNSEPEAVAIDQIKLSDGIICSTEYIKEKAQEMFPGKRIYVVKNSIDFDIWDKLERPRKLHEENPDLIRLVYTGCGTHSGDLELVKKPILALLEEFPGLEFLSLPYPSWDDVTHPRFKRIDRWVELSTYPQWVMSWEPDIGIAPLRDHHLNRAKSNLRWLEFSAMKVPTIASNIYPFKHSITNGKDGILVNNNSNSWFEGIRSLIVDHGRRTAIGQNAYEKVRKDYSMEDVAVSYRSILQEIKREFIRTTERDRAVAGRSD